MKKILIAILISILFVSGCSVKKIEDVGDNEKFAKEYSITQNNNFKYATYNEIINVLKEGSGIIFFANQDCEWCLSTAEILNDSLNFKDVKENIYYYNPNKIKTENTEEYKKLLELLDKYLTVDENGSKELLMPDIYLVKKGKIIGHNNDLATIKTNPNEYLTEERIKEIKEKFENLISTYNVKECKTC